MMRNIILFVCFLAMFAMAQFLSRIESSFYFAFISLSSIFILWFLFIEDSVFLGVSLWLVTFSLLWHWAGTWNIWCLAFLAILFALSGSFLYYLKAWKKKILSANEQKDESVEALSAIKQRVSEKQDSLRGITVQLEDILRLFELADKLNECLSFEEVVSVLKDRIVGTAKFRKAVLLIYAGEVSPPSIVRRLVIWEEGKVEDTQGEEDLSRFEKKMIQDLSSKKENLRFHDVSSAPSAWVEGSDVSFPLWIFPLTVQGKVIALFLIEGGREEDDQKFQVVASQLALHIKKIKLYETVKELSIVDGLTHVFVRRHFLERFEEELKRTIRHEFKLAVVMLDIDHFKTYNDNYGHLVGDVTLRQVAQVIRSSVRRVDIVSRYGGEEFAMVLPETDKVGAMEVAERIRSAVAKKRFKVYDEETKVTVSIGVSSFPDDLDEAHRGTFRSDLLLELLKKSDYALYQAKEEGRNRVVLFDKEKHKLF